MRRALTALLAASPLPPMARFVLQTVAQIASETGSPAVGLTAVAKTVGRPNIDAEVALLQRSEYVEIDENSASLSLSKKYLDLTRGRDVTPTGLQTRASAPPRTRARAVKQAPPLSKDDILDLVERWKDTFSAEEVHELCFEAMSHKNAKDWDTAKAGCSAWLRRQAGWRKGAQGRGNGNANQNRPANGAQRPPGPRKSLNDLFGRDG